MNATVQVSGGLKDHGFHECEMVTVNINDYISITVVGSGIEIELFDQNGNNVCAPKWLELSDVVRLAKRRV